MGTSGVTQLSCLSTGVRSGSTYESMKSFHEDRCYLYFTIVRGRKRMKAGRISRTNLSRIMWSGRMFLGRCFEHLSTC
jgi:hypothetical protein